METKEIRFTLQTDEEIEKFDSIKDFLKIPKNSKLLSFLISEKYQEIQKIQNYSHKEK